ncbi:MAG: cob(I)yrinic acid a,c-diamide adenosyltransferase [Gammaproteobacteria bacterium]|nr:cob(I)yrinic acid a,c-diamide adenosyltransferase [Gammaproteobacteria bacterium]
MSDAELNQRHNERMAKKKAVVDEKIQQAQREQGVLVVNTGNGKGKSSAAFGMAARALGHDMKVGIVQFIKGASSTGEESFFRRIPGVDYFVMGEGFTWETQDRDRDVAAAEAAWEKARAMLSDPAYELVLLDELNIVLKYQYLDINTVIADLQTRPEMQHVVITGRAARPELIEIANTVTEMNMVKHAFKSGIKAQKGVEL